MAQFPNGFRFITSQCNARAAASKIKDKTKSSHERVRGETVWIAQNRVDFPYLRSYMYIKE